MMVVNRIGWTMMTSVYLLRTCSISAPNLSMMVFGTSAIYISELSFWLSNIGLNYLLYKDEFLARLPIGKRVTYSSFLSIMFNFGSMMIVHSLSHFFGRIESLRLISSLTLSTCLLSIGYVYLDDLHNRSQL